MTAPARLALAALLLAAVPLAAQVQVPRVSESIEVRITNVDVVVLDASGKRVRGLTKSDFEVLDGGKPQPITNFSEYAIEPRQKPAEVPGQMAQAAQPSAATAPPPRHIIIFFDAFSTARDDRRRLIPALTRLVRDLRPEDEAMVVCWNRSLRVLVPPTTDHAALEKGIERAASEISLRKEAQTLFPDRLGDLPVSLGPAATTAARRDMEIRADSRRRATDAMIDLNQSSRGLRAMLSQLAGVEGRKALILVSTAYSFMPPAGETGSADRDLLLWLETMNAPPMLKDLADAGSAAGVSIYGIQAEGLQSGWSAKVPGDKATGEGLEVPVGAVYSADIPSLDAARTSGSKLSGLTYLASRTGGFAAGNANTFSTALAAIGEDLGTYYSIGYNSPEPTAAKRRNIAVRTRDRRYTVRSRHSAIDRSPLEEMADRVTAALFFPSSLPNQLGITATTGTVDRNKERTKVPIDVKIPMVNLTFESGESELLVADLTIMIASAGAEGSLSEVERFHQTIPITRAQFPQLSKAHYTYKIAVDLRNAAGESRLSIAVIDNISKAMGSTVVAVAGK